MTDFLFVGEKPSLKARERNWTWRDGRLCARTLFDALLAAGINPEAQQFINLFLDHSDYIVDSAAFQTIQEAAQGTCIIVALGRRVSRSLGSISHRQLIHPAARGSIRRRENYQRHVKEVLCASPKSSTSEPSRTSSSD